MLLVIDAGNTHTVIGLYENGGLRAHWRLFTSHYRTKDELGILLSALLQQEGALASEVNACCISSVAPPLDTALLALSREAFGVEPIVVGPGVKTGLVIQVDNPKEVGADRIVNAVGARTQYDGPLIIVDFGTAMTFDVVSAHGEYQGGCIVPGIQIAADALFERCAKLPRVDISAPPSVIGKDTISHIQVGLTYGYAELVDGLLRRMAEEMGTTPTVVAAGGYADLIADIAQRIDHVDPLLTVKGLKNIYERNSPAKDGG